MAVESKLWNALTGSVTLTALVSSCIYPVTRRQQSITPAVSFRRAGGERLYCITDYCNHENPHYEFQIFTTTVVQLRTVGAALLGALSSATAYGFKAIVIPSPSDNWDDDIGTYIRIYDASLWNAE